VVLTVRVSLQVNNGAGGHVVTIYTSTNFGSTWTQLGTTLNAGAFTTSVQVTTAAVQLGAAGAAGTSAMLSGKVYSASVYSDVTLSTTVLNVDCDAITSGAATSFVATTGQTVTINRATSGRKSVAMPSKVKGGRPLMLLGTDDYLECLDAAQHGLLNFYGGQSFSIVMVARHWPTLVSGNALISKADVNTRSATAPRWNMRYGTSSTVFGQVDDGASYTESGSPTLTLGALSSSAFLVTAGDVKMGIGSAAATSVARTSKHLANRATVQVGRFAATGYGEFEFTAAAIFRRALTAREITVINNAAPWGT